MMRFEKMLDRLIAVNIPAVIVAKGSKGYTATPMNQAAYDALVLETNHTSGSSVLHALKNLVNQHRAFLSCVVDNHIDRKRKL